MAKLSDGARKRALLGMKAFYVAVITEMQKLPLADELLCALTCLNPKMQKSPRSIEYCRVVAHRMPSITKDEQLKAAAEWIKYQELDFSQDDCKGRVDHFWRSLPGRRWLWAKVCCSAKDGEMCLGPFPFKCRC